MWGPSFCLASTSAQLPCAAVLRCIHESDYRWKQRLGVQNRRCDLLLCWCC
jgi:hypothetical protein